MHLSGNRQNHFTCNYTHWQQKRYRYLGHAAPIRDMIQNHTKAWSTSLALQDPADPDPADMPGA